MEEQNDLNLWALVFTPSGKYIGKVGDKSAAMKHWEQGLPVEIEDAFEFVCANMLQQTARGPVIARELRVLPLGSHRHTAKVYSKPTDIWFFADMEEQDAKAYMDLVKAARDMQQEQRMSDMGIVGAPPTGGLPSIGRG